MSTHDFTTQIALPPFKTEGAQTLAKQAAMQVGKGYVALRARNTVGHLAQRINNRLTGAQNFVGTRFGRNSVLRLYDQLAGSYIQEQESLTPEDETLALVGDELCRLKTLDFLDYKYRYLADLIANLTPTPSLLEVGAGELNTLTGVLDHLPTPPERVVALDLSWSRLFHGKSHLERRGRELQGYVTGDATALPFLDNSFDLIFTCHCLEPNPLTLAPVLAELGRVARRYVVLVEPAYELAHSVQRRRVRKSGYVRGIPKVAAAMGYKVVSHHLMPVREYLNGSAVTVLEINCDAPLLWGGDFLACPATRTPLIQEENWYFSVQSGCCYPQLRGIACLDQANAVLASHFPKKAKP